LMVLLGAAEWLRLHRGRADALAQRREAEFRRWASEERVAIARELHDVLAHSIAVISIQANTALHLMDRQPDRARTALVVINDVSKQVLGEIRSVVGVLRDVDEGLPRAPVPTINRLGELARITQAAGVDVQLRVSGSVSALPSAVDAAAYRIVQEALTNTVRHAAAGGAEVDIERIGDTLRIRVADRGTVVGPVVEGNGICGMRERVLALGGVFTAGPGPDGFEVTAAIPVAEVPS
jgi:signal transduction histidine kinase